MLESPEFNAIKHPSQYPCGIFHGFLLAQLDVAFAQVFGVGAFVDAGHGEGTAGPGRGFFKNQGDVLAFQGVTENAGTFVGFQCGGKVDQVFDFLGGEIEKLQEIASLEVFSHSVLLSRLARVL